MATEELDGQPILIAPALDQKCSKYFTYRSFIECGETQPKLPTPNLPIELASYGAISKLASLVLDPVWLEPPPRDAFYQWHRASNG